MELRTKQRRRAKIVCTLGPSSADTRTVARMIRAGMDVARLNFSHGDHASHARLLATLRRAAAGVGRPIAVLQDLGGPKIRVGELPGGSVEIREGQEVTLYPGDAPGRRAEGVPVRYPNLGPDMARDTRTSSLHDALALGVERVARSLEVSAIVVITRSGATARYVASSRPRVPVLALSSNSRALRSMALFWSVTPVPCRPIRNPLDALRLSERAALKLGAHGSSLAAA